MGAVVRQELDPREERFVALYCDNPNATRAYIAAGFDYSTEGVAATLASRLLKRVHIRKAIEQRTARFLQRYEMTPQRIVNEIAKIAGANVDDFISINDDGSLSIDFSDATREQMASLQSVEAETHTIGSTDDGAPVIKRTNKFKQYDRLRALEMLAKMSQLFPAEKREHSGPGGGPIPQLHAHAHKVDLADLDWDQRQALRQLLQSVQQPEPEPEPQE